jgi:hypothetical protein
VAELDRELGSLPNVKPAKVLDVLEDEDWEGLGESFDGVIIGSYAPSERGDRNR